MKTITIDARLEQLEQQAAAAGRRIAKGREEIEAGTNELRDIEHRQTTITVARSTLNALPPLAPEEKWRDHLKAWRQAFQDELRAIPEDEPRARPPRMRTDAQLGQVEALTFSIALIDRGLGIHKLGPIVDLTNTLLGTLMQAAGYAVKGEELHGPNGWRGSLPDVEEQIQWLKQTRADAVAALDEAMLDDATRARRAAAARSRSDASPAAADVDYSTERARTRGVESVREKLLAGAEQIGNAG